jgi:hypothetical protein
MNMVSYYGPPHHFQHHLPDDIHGLLNILLTLNMRYNATFSATEDSPKPSTNKKPSFTPSPFIHPLSESFWPRDPLLRKICTTRRLTVSFAAYSGLLQTVRARRRVYRLPNAKRAFLEHRLTLLDAQKSRAVDHSTCTASFRED